MCIVAGGHKQIEGINYTETFSAAAKLPSVCVVLAKAAMLDWEIHHVDIKSAYLNAPLKETVYMKILRGAAKPGQQGKVCCLLKGIYGLKQSGRGWYQAMSKVFTQDLGFTKSALDHSVFYRRGDGEETVTAVATDDMIIASKWLQDVIRLKAELKKHWDLSDMGEIKWYLSFEVKWDRPQRTISINQQAYIESLADRFRLVNAKPVTTPMAPGVAFTPNEQTSGKKAARTKGIPYAEAIGSVLWPAMISRPDVSYAVGVLAQFVQDPNESHWEGVKRVIVYLNTTKDIWLTFGRKSPNLAEGFCDADWGSQNH